MIEHCLYGVKVFADFPLFEGIGPGSAVPPGEHSNLCLKRQPEDGPELKMPHRIPLYNTHGRDLYLCTDHQVAQSVAGQNWQLEVEGVVSFSWVGGGSMVYYQLHEEGTPALLVFWFVHIFLPLHLTLERGYDFIHCAAVEVEDKPLLFIAPSTGGKSTLADYFLKQGHALLTDDKAATFLHEEAFFVAPSHPHHRPFRQFEVLGHPVENFATHARPVHAIYILEAGEPESEVEISEVTGFRKFEELFPNYLYDFRFLQQQRMRWLAQLADQSLVFRLRRPWNLSRMPQVYAAICEHVGQVQA